MNAKLGSNLVAIEHVVEEQPGLSPTHWDGQFEGHLLPEFTEPRYSVNHEHRVDVGGPTAIFSQRRRGFFPVVVFWQINSSFVERMKDRITRGGELHLGVGHRRHHSGQEHSIFPAHRQNVATFSELIVVTSSSLTLCLKHLHFSLSNLRLAWCENILSKVSQS